MSKWQPVWNEDAIAESNKIIHYQDMIVTGLTECLDDLRKQDYGYFVGNLRALGRVVEILMRVCGDFLPRQDVGGFCGRP